MKSILMKVAFAVSVLALVACARPSTVHEDPVSMAGPMSVMAQDTPPGPSGYMVGNQVYFVVQYPSSEKIGMLDLMGQVDHWEKANPVVRIADTIRVPLRSQSLWEWRISGSGRLDSVR